MQNSKGESHQRTRLAHHLSMPTSSAELSAMEQLLQDSVPCKVRAKRGCATHPRSIAERVNRTSTFSILLVLVFNNAAYLLGSNKMIVEFVL